MKSRILLLGVALIGLGSCSTMYKSGQTPDDIYYSPAPQMRTASSDDEDENYAQNGSDEYVNVQTEQDRSAYNSDDNYLRMKVRNRSMWSAFDNYAMYDAMYSPYYGGFGGYGLGYGYNPYSFYSPYSMYSPYYGSGWGLGIGWGGLYGGWNSFYNPYNSFYNPYYGGGYYYPGGGKGSVTRPANSYRPRTYNLGSYGTNNNSSINNNTNTPRRVFRSNDNNYVNPGRSSGTTSPRRSTYSSGNDSRPSRNYDSPRSSSSSPSYTPSSSSGSSRSSGGGGGGSAPSRPGRQ
ncbi:MAG: hypothetical protein QM768_05745 [Agriterribacter sp.]